MLNFVLIAAVAYLMYTWGSRLQVRAHIFGQVWLEKCGYVCSLASGTAVALYSTLTLVQSLEIQASVIEISLVSTVLSVLFGEYLYSRSSKLSLRTLAPLRSKKQER